MNFWNTILSALQSEKRICLLYVIESKGSSPGRTGFKQFVSDDGEMNGSIGGGPMEQRLIELAKTCLNEQKTDIFFKRQIHTSNAVKDKSGMICSGEQTVAFYFLDSKHIKLTSEIAVSFSENSDSVLELTQNGIAFISGKTLSTHFQSSIISESEWRFEEQLNFTNTVCIIGGGHVGLALSRTMNQLGFRVEIFDNRENLNTISDNRFAHKKTIIDYESIDLEIPEGDHVYAVLTSFGFKTDEQILKKVIRKKFAYLGMMGSVEKVKKLFSNLLNDGFTQQEIDWVHSPIGIQINSQTPEEIAISIAAEIVKVKNKK